MSPFLSSPLFQITSPYQKAPLEDSLFEDLMRCEAGFMGKEGLVAIAEEIDYFRPLIDQYVLDICSSLALAWKYELGGNHRPFLQPLYLARYSGLLQAFGGCMVLDRSARAYQPNICNEILYEAMATLNFREKHGAEPMAVSADPYCANWELENHLIEKVRSLSQGRGFRRSAYETQRSYEDNHATGERFLSAAFAARSRIEVARIDLYYQKAFQPELTISQVQTDFRRLWANWKRKCLPKSVFEDLMGYIWGLEYTDDSRYHFHVILIYKGSDVKAGFGRALRVKKYWETDITEGRGYARVCNAKDYPRELVYLGEVEAHHEEKRALLLRKGVGYLAKPDQLLPIRLKKIRTFDTSALPKQASSAGRPRLPLKERAPRRSSEPFQAKRKV
ncbi:YagK/YfjJ domain-containing protein [Variovorax sp. tm]|uniref:YagK/YfjJ domain-containing protein n=1 Tax=Variovorax atrisoli TaxID=3394203 RepID=UPI003A80752B